MALCISPGYDSQIDVFYGAWYDGGDLVVDYEPRTGPAVSVVGCKPSVATASL